VSSPPFQIPHTLPKVLLPERLECLRSRSPGTSYYARRSKEYLSSKLLFPRLGMAAQGTSCFHLHSPNSYKRLSLHSHEQLLLPHSYNVVLKLVNHFGSRDSNDSTSIFHRFIKESCFTFIRTVFRISFLYEDP
jgi:hypothetical protein